MIIKPGRLTLPVAPDSVFGRSGPLVLEIGFGDGRYLTYLGHEHPDWNILGVEISMGSMWRAYRRMKREQLEHIRLYHGDARFLLRDVIPTISLKTIFVNFPDPWPRKRHQKNRLLQADFFDMASTRLQSGGTISLTTDHKEYFEFATLEAKRTGLYQIEPAEPTDAALQTKYAVKWQDQGKPIFHTLFHKTGEGKPRPALIEQIEMQHAILAGALSTVTEFDKVVRAFDGGHVIVLEAFRALSGDGIVFKVLVEETDLRQEVLIQAWQKGDEVYVGLEAFGDPLGTRGVKEAVRAVAQWLSDQGLEIKQTWI